MEPIISVIMSTYNTPNEWLYESINSILKQIYKDFEFIIVNDCSTTNVLEVKNSILDDRIIWIKNNENIGLTKSLNKALKIAKGKYIARMDADDISLPERFSIQVKYMEKHPNIIVSGFYREAIGEETGIEAWNIPKTREEQQAILFFFNCGLTHPTAMFRHSMLKEYNIQYNESYIKAQDYGMWVQCTRYAPMAMIPKVLLKYRKSNLQATSNKQNIKLYDSMIKIDQLKAIGIQPSESEIQMHIALCNFSNFENADKMYEWICKIDSSNQKSQYFNVKVFSKILKTQWYRYSRNEVLKFKCELYKKYYENLRKYYLLYEIKQNIYSLIQAKL